MTSAAVAVLLASAVAPPSSGVWPSPAVSGAGGRSGAVAAPQAGPSEPIGPGGAQGTVETPKEREQRLIREGIRQPSQRVVTPSQDYLSVLGRRLDSKGEDPVRPASLWFGFGFASQVPLSESSGRRSRYLGSHHVFGQVWSWSDAGGDDQSTGACSSAVSSAREPSSAGLCSFSSLHVLAMGSLAEVSIEGKLTDGSRSAFDVLVSDFDVGLAYRHDWYRLLGSSGLWSFGPSVMFGVLPLRQRIITRYGDARAEHADMRKSGLAFNAAGTVSRLAFSLMALSIFEGTAFVGFVTGSPSEVRLWGGLEFSLKAPREREPAPPAESSVKTKGPQPESTQPGGLAQPSPKPAAPGGKP